MSDEIVRRLKCPDCGTELEQMKCPNDDCSVTWVHIYRTPRPKYQR